jgi:hypothetical protein
VSRREHCHDHSHNHSIVRTTERLYLGRTVERNGTRYIVTSVYDDGLAVLTAIPDAMTEHDYSRRFAGARLEVMV